MNDEKAIVVISGEYVVTHGQAAILTKQAEETIADVAMELRRRPMLAARIAFALNNARLAENYKRSFTRRPEITIPDTALNRVWADIHRGNAEILGHPIDPDWRDNTARFLHPSSITCEWEQETDENTLQEGQN